MNPVTDSYILTFPDESEIIMKHEELEKWPYFQNLFACKTLVIENSEKRIKFDSINSSIFACVHKILHKKLHLSSIIKTIPRLKSDPYLHEKLRHAYSYLTCQTGTTLLDKLVIPMYWMTNYDEASEIEIKFPEPLSKNIPIRVHIAKKILATSIFFATTKEHKDRLKYYKQQKFNLWNKGKKTKEEIKSIENYSIKEIWQASQHSKCENRYEQKNAEKARIILFYYQAKVVICLEKYMGELKLDTTNKTLRAILGPPFILAYYNITPSIASRELCYEKYKFNYDIRKYTPHALEKQIRQDLTKYFPKFYKRPLFSPSTKWKSHSFESKEIRKKINAIAFVIASKIKSNIIEINSWEKFGITPIDLYLGESGSSKGYIYGTLAHKKKVYPISLNYKTHKLAILGEDMLPLSEKKTNTLLQKIKKDKSKNSILF